MKFLSSCHMSNTFKTTVKWLWGGRYNKRQQVCKYASGGYCI